MFVHLKTGYNTDMGPAWISRVRFSKTWKTAYWQGRTLRRWQGASANFVDVASGEEFWWLGWTGLVGCLPFLVVALLHLADSGQLDAPRELFEQGDALLIAIAFMGSGIYELQRLPRAQRPTSMDAMVLWVIVLSVLSASLFGYMWPRIDGGTLTSLQRTMLGWISLAVLIVSLGIGCISIWLATGAAVTSEGRA